MLAATATSGKAQSLELRILRLGLRQDWNVGIGVFPNGEEVLIGGFCLGLISRQRVSPAQAESFRAVAARDGRPPVL
jgi:hypothetical protein